MSTVTCQTEDCPNGGIPIELSLDLENEDGSTSRVDSVQCGVCGQEITDISD